ncbi:T9SS type A sorting domain-containing protein [Aquirufa aurantiipilula]|uniref:T9SS type A sorting domain-containing protein n=1 Tax=Aquirufa aurantiipilula TaxID=2696561 RepID=A0ABT6BMR8_9BACT|nr:T9SS type A sorting domain-containing protein [Aquirufa aurantiipilula]MDF5691772.1 T9SS type A sorting domain-containing protein [Aquirufa aurantiipilula]
MMNKFFKFNLSAILVSLMAFSVSAQVINGKFGTSYSVVPNGEAKALVASGCPAGSFYDWASATNGGASNYSDQSTSFDLAYPGAGDGSSVTAYAMTLDDKAGGNRPPYVYELRCVLPGGGAPAGYADRVSRVYITPIVDMNSYNANPSIYERTCADLGNPSVGTLALRASGCPDGTSWMKPDGTVTDAFNADAIRYNGEAYLDGPYNVRCIVSYLDNVTLAPKQAYTQWQRFDVKKAYTPPTLTVSSVKALLPDNSTKEVCKGSLVDLTTNVPDFNRYNNFFEFRWYAYDEYVPGKNILGAQRFGATVNGNVLTAIAEKKSVIYYVDLKDRAGVCGTKESNQVRITYVDLPKPGPITGNLGYCIEGTTTLKVDSASLVRNEGYLISTGVPTKPSIFRWYVDGVETAALGNASSIIFKQNAKVKVDYVSNYNCPSPASDEVTIKNYDKPVTPTITALKPANGSLVTASTVGFCEGTPIAGQLQASSLPNGEATKWEWSNALTTSLIDYNKVGFYTVKTINANGCYSESSAAVEVKVLALPAAPTITAGSATTFCARKEDDYSAFNAVTLTASTSNSIVNWYGNANTSLSTLKVFEGVKTSDTYYTRATDIYGCISPASNKIKVSVQQNPVATDARIVKEGVYTLKALNFPATVTGGTASDYEWKFGTTALPSKSYITKVKTNGDYSVRRKYLYAIDGFPLTCYTDFTKYAYTLDPEFNGVAIFPNPVTKPDVDGVNIQILDDWTNATVTLYDMVGRPVYSGKIPALNAANPEPTNILKLPGLGNGIYIVTITADNSKSYTGKIIVSK